mmetsp:Transcript_33072/g.76299  ORF Transcript_33072/g.76299 Transcript_33072/m.76299 type:complete len:388 (-) Transcript_33072:401-1564(-)
MRSASASCRALLARRCLRMCPFSSSSCARTSFAPTCSRSRETMSARSESRTETATDSSSASSPVLSALASVPPAEECDEDCRSTASSSPTRRVSFETFSVWRRRASSASHSSFSSASMLSTSWLFSAPSCAITDSLDFAVRPSLRATVARCSSARANRSPYVSSTVANWFSSIASRSAATCRSSASALSFSRLDVASSACQRSSAAACCASLAAICSRRACSSSRVRSARSSRSWPRRRRELAAISAWSSRRVARSSASSACSAEPALDERSAALPPAPGLRSAGLGCCSLSLSLGSGSARLPAVEEQSSSSLSAVPSEPSEETSLAAAPACRRYSLSQRELMSSESTPTAIPPRSTSTVCVAGSEASSEAHWARSRTTRPSLFPER